MSLVGALTAIAAPVATMWSKAGEAVVNNYFNRKAASRQYGYEQSLMDYQNQWNLEQWNRENEYNTPKNIMARYQEAGLNPNLIYGNSYASPAHLESATGHAPQVKPTQLDMTNALLTAYNLEAQNQLLDAQKKEVNARTGLINTQTRNWTTDHTNTTKEIIEGIAAVLGIDTSKGRLGAAIGDYIKKAIEKGQDSGRGSNLLEFDGRPIWEVKHEARKRFYEKYGYFPNF